MANYVRTKIIMSKGISEDVFASLNYGNDIDLSMINPQNLYVCEVDWGYKDDVGFIMFDVMWKYPTSIIEAFNDMFRVDFSVKYFEEAPLFWGIEEWKNGILVSWNTNPDDIKKELYFELYNQQYDDYEE